MLKILSNCLTFLLAGLAVAGLAACSDDDIPVTRVMDIDLGSNGFKMLKVTGMGTDYYIGLTEVTNGLWKAMMGSKPEGQSNDGDDYPVTMVSYEEITRKGGFLERLNRLVDSRGLTFMLPTQAEWQFAARGGQRSRGYDYAGSNTVTDVAWFGGDSGGTAHPVATKRGNEIGIYDMSGGVWELTASSGADGLSVCCGGAWSSPAGQCRITSTCSENLQGNGSSDIGFRLVLK